MTTPRTQPSTGDTTTGSESGVPDKVLREAVGLLLLSLAVLGSLVVLGSLHWAAGASAAFLGLGVAGVLGRGSSTTRWKRDAGAFAAGIGCAGLIGVLLWVMPPVGALCAFAFVGALGYWLASAEGA